ncbi:AmmeMemoRadiSam system protein B [Chitinispirillales bacterium ANBcel5]|uniref:AmmeMemoRadiSam system protein B n=1 Tax=Cellulosispirillum alkaliphilum TaxID=3039283 RepID=UPI002A568860|nr:AmmeMemoRadiSam system protein B [Chitinispirillales bacterium ANBcel5]
MYKKTKHIRKPAVAGKFYSASKTMLLKEVKSMLDAVPNERTDVRLLISPHAGYIFSGVVAAKGFKLVSKEIKRVFIIGPSHHKFVNGIHISDAHFYSTPLGDVEIDLQVVNKLKSNTLTCNTADADSLEHCIEVQLPFLQVQLDDFLLIPILVGKVDPKCVADLISPYIDCNTLVIASSDLSHFKNQQDARHIDDNSIKTVIKGNAYEFIDGCGENAIRVIMHLAKKMNLTPSVLDARTSFDTAPQFGSGQRVVGYTSIAFF